MEYVAYLVSFVLRTFPLLRPIAIQEFTQAVSILVGENTEEVGHASSSITKSVSDVIIALTCLTAMAKLIRCDK